MDRHLFSLSALLRDGLRGKEGLTARWPDAPRLHLISCRPAQHIEIHKIKRETTTIHAESRLAPQGEAVVHTCRLPGAVVPNEPQLERRGGPSL